MSKADFFVQLRNRLWGLPYEEQQNIMKVYEDLFLQLEASGKSELEIIQSLGYMPVPMQSPPPGVPPRMEPAKSGLRKAFAFIALSLFNLIFATAPILTVAALLFSLWLMGVVFTFSPLWILLGTGIPDTLQVLMFEICVSLVLSGLGVLLVMGMWKSNKYFYALFKKYIALNMRLIRGD